MTRSDRRPRPMWSVVVRIVLGVVALGVPAWVAVTRWSTLVAGHPAYPVLLAVVAAAGVLLVVRARSPVRPGRLRTVGRGLAAVGLTVVVAAAVYLRPDAADPVVVVVKPPLDLGPLAVGAVDDAVRAHPECDRWAVGGHSLGGVAAVLAVDDPRVHGLFLWASYPISEVTEPVAALSVSGDRDGVIDPAGLDRSRALLPPGSRFVIVPGAVHAYFGDYGPQAGDGVPTVDRGTAQREIIAVTSDLVAGLPR